MVGAAGRAALGLWRCRGSRARSLRGHSDIASATLWVRLRRLRIFIMLSLLWGGAVDGTKLDRFNIEGGSICLFGMLLMVYSPRSE